MKHLAPSPRLVLSCPCCNIGQINPDEYRSGIHLNAPIGLFDFNSDNAYTQSVINLIENGIIKQISIIGNYDCAMLKNSLESNEHSFEFKYQSKIKALQKRNDTPLKLIKRICEKAYKGIHEHQQLGKLIQQKSIKINIELIAKKNKLTLINYYPNVGIYNTAP
ncbi:MAG: hypothetical protein RL138_214 [Bacteroidota bacterium]|jgi:hypothetical protein